MRVAIAMTTRGSPEIISLGDRRVDVAVLRVVGREGTGNEKNVAKWLGLGGRDKQAKQLVQVWARAYRIAGPCVTDHRPETGPTGGATLAEPSALAPATIEHTASH